MRPRYVTHKRLVRLERTLTPRDRALIDTLDQLRVATTLHLRQLHYAEYTPASAARLAPHTLRRLQRLRVVTQLDRQLGGIRAGSRSAVWSLDVAGQKLASGCGPAGGSRLRRAWTPGLAFLSHRLAVTTVYVELVEVERTGRIQNLSFEAEPQSWRRFTTFGGASEYLKPDAAVRLTRGAFERGVFLEIDRATQGPTTIMRKLCVYSRYWESGREQQRHGYFPEVVFSVPSEARQKTLTGVVAHHRSEARELFRVVLAADLLTVIVEGAG
jgi:hypothetical protein